MNHESFLPRDPYLVMQILNLMRRTQEGVVVGGRRSWREEGDEIGGISQREAETTWADDDDDEKEEMRQETGGGGRNFRCWGRVRVDVMIGLDYCQTVQS